MSDNFLQSNRDKTENAIKVVNRLLADRKFSEFAREKFNEVGIKGDSTKAEDMLDELYDIAYGVQEIVDGEGNKRHVKKEETENRIKAIKTFAEMVGGGLNEKQTNIQNNISGNFFLDMLSNKN